METQFPTESGFAGMFFVGVRKASGATQRVGAVVLKRAYDVDAAAHALVPRGEPAVLHLQDQPDNRVVNGDFEADGETTGQPAEWTAAAGLGLSTANADGVDATKALRVSGPAGAAVTQTIAFDAALGGRRFAFSFYAKAQSGTPQIANLRLEAGPASICSITQTLSTSLTRFSAVGQWPADRDETEMQVVLRAGSAGAVFYDRVQVEERPHVTEWNDATLPRQESDLKPFKPVPDLLLLEGTASAGTHTLSVNGVPWLTRVLPGAPRPKSLFGWEPSVGGPREVDAGTFPTDPNAYPLADPLPADFDNAFYNGHRRTSAPEGITASVPGTPLPADAEITWRRNAVEIGRFRLAGEPVQARYHYYRGAGPDEEAAWGAAGVPMRPDTVVWHGETARCEVIWRGQWPFDLHPEDAYRRLVVTAAAEAL